MREILLIATNYFLFTLSQILLSGLQTSLWLQLFGSFPPPLFWLPAFSYWAIFRKSTEGILICYLSALTLSAYSAAPFANLLVLSLLLLFIVHKIKSRIMWDGPTYFMLINFIAAVFFPVLHFFLSRAVDKNPIENFSFFAWILSSLLTALVALPLHHFFSIVDRWTLKDLPSELGANQL